MYYLGLIILCVVGYLAVYVVSLWLVRRRAVKKSVPEATQQPAVEEVVLLENEVTA